MDEGQARNPNTTYNGNSGSLLDMEAHMPSATQNNSKKNKKKYFTGVIPPKTKVTFSVSIGNSPRYFISSETFLTSKERYHSSSKSTED